ncbi:MAG: RimK family alpha-L-glutamate ligase [Candidatus Hydrogenedentes bacterium]|nr:RimK family alpha-L-glutamate ligase [Candidatus Hydrogenedentota bacterium]
MKLCILSRDADNYSTSRLVEAARKRGHDVTVTDTLKFSILLEQEQPALFYDGAAMDPCDAVIPRIGASITFYGLAVLRQFEQMGVYCANGSSAISRSRDKLQAIQILSRHDIGIPPTAFVREKNEILPAIKRVGGTPVIIKLLEGTQGVGVILAESEKVAKAIIETLHSARQNVLIQKFVAESRGRDVRAFVVGDRVVAAMRRLAEEGEFRSNVHQGGKTEKVVLDKQHVETAVRAAQILGLNIAGVDMLESNEGPQVMEVNSSPGLEGIEGITEIDVANAVIRHVEDAVQFPRVDLKQRLRLNAGYGVVEFHVHGLPELEGKKLRETNLSACGIHVMSIRRKQVDYPNPTGDARIETGDTLLCYGDLRTLRAMLPRNHKPKPERKPRPKATGQPDQFD